MFLKPDLKRIVISFLLSLLLLNNLAFAKQENLDFIELGEPLALEVTFGRLSMNDAIKLAIMNNPKVTIEKALVEEKSWAIKEEKSYLYPQLYVYQDFMASNNPVHAFMLKLSQRNFNFAGTNINYPGTKCNFSTRLGGDLTILDQKIYKKIDISKLEFEIQKQLGKQEVFNLIKDVRKSYLDLQLSKQMVSNAQYNLEYANAHYEAVKNKKDQGTANKSDFLGARVQLSSAQEQLAKSKNNLNLAWITFAELVGEDNIIGFELDDGMSADYPVDDIDKLVKYAYLHSPAISSVEIGKQKAVLDLKLAKKTGSLNIKAHGDWGVDTIFDDRNIARGYTAAVFLNKSIFDGGLRRSKIKQAKAKIERKNAEIDQTYRQIKVGVVQNYLSLMNAKERYNMTKDLVKDAEESLRAYSERYDVGLANSVEVEAAQSKLSDARLLKYHALYDVKLSIVNLQRSVGMPLSDILSGRGLVLLQSDPEPAKPKQDKTVKNKQTSMPVQKEQTPSGTEQKPSVTEKKPVKNIFDKGSNFTDGPFSGGSALDINKPVDEIFKFSPGGVDKPVEKDLNQPVETYDTDKEDKVPDKKIETEEIDLKDGSTEEVFIIYPDDVATPPENEDVESPDELQDQTPDSSNNPDDVNLKEIENNNEDKSLTDESEEVEYVTKITSDLRMISVPVTKSQPETEEASNNYVNKQDNQQLEDQ